MADDSYIRPELTADEPGIRCVHESAFPTPGEAALVDALRAAGKTIVSLVLESAGKILGHVLFSPVTIDRQACNGLGLAPVAVLPEEQRRGCGSRLVRAGLDACRQARVGFVVVLGAPGYYHRFGFRTASALGLKNEYGAGEAFMVVELVSGALPPGGGLVRYAPEFAEVSP